MKKPETDAAPADAARHHSTTREWYESLLVAGVFVLFVRTFVVQTYQVPTGSMERTILVGSPDEVDTIVVPDTDNLVWISQTTLSVDETMDTVHRLRERFPHLQDPPSDDICYATQNRQVAIKKVAPDADLVIVVGSANSSNSVRLVEVALEYGAKAAHRKARCTSTGSWWERSPA